MRILADSVVTQATITATNTLSFSPESNLQIYQLADKWKCSQGTTQIVLDFGATVPDVDYVALCGTNISESATLSVSYSSTSPASPEVTTLLPAFSNFNQVWMYMTTVNRRYWMIDINDPDPQGANGIEIGYLSVGEYRQIESWDFPHTPTLNLSMIFSTSPTLQEYGTHVVDWNDMTYTVSGLSATEAAELLSFVKQAGNEEHFVLVQYEDSIDNPLYPPRYGIFTENSYSYQAENPNNYSLTFTFEERY